MERRTASSLLLVSLVFLSTAERASAQVDLTIFVGSAYPVYDDRLTLRPSVPSLPGAEVTVSGSPEITATGGLVVGGALAFEAGVLGIEGRIDSTAVGLNLAGARYDVRASSGPLQGLTGSVTVGDGQFDADRFQLLSINARLRTPGPFVSSCLEASATCRTSPSQAQSRCRRKWRASRSSVASRRACAWRLRRENRSIELASTVAPGSESAAAGSAHGRSADFLLPRVRAGFNVADAPPVVEDLLEGLDPVASSRSSSTRKRGSCFDSISIPPRPYLALTVVMGRSGRVPSVKISSSRSGISSVVFHSRLTRVG